MTGFDLDTYLRRELRDTRLRVEFLERERARLEQLAAHFLLLLTPNHRAGLLLLDALAEALNLHPASQGPPAPKHSRRRLPERRMIDLLTGP